MGGTGAEGTNVDAAATGINAADHQFFRFKTVPQPLVNHFTNFFVKMVLVANGNQVAQQAPLVGQTGPFNMDVGAAPVGLMRDFTVAAQQMGRYLKDALLVSSSQQCRKIGRASCRERV